MYFDNDKRPNAITGGSEEGLQWKRLFNLIITERKSDMRKFLTQINKRFYAQIAKKALKQKITMLKKNKKGKNKVSLDKLASSLLQKLVNTDDQTSETPSMTNIHKLKSGMVARRKLG